MLPVNVRIKYNIQSEVNADLPELGNWASVPGSPLSSLHVTLICFPHKPRFPKKLQGKKAS